MGLLQRQRFGGVLYFLRFACKSTLGGINTSPEEPRHPRQISFLSLTSHLFLCLFSGSQRHPERSSSPGRLSWLGCRPAAALLGEANSLDPLRLHSTTLLWVALGPPHVVTPCFNTPLEQTVHMPVSPLEGRTDLQGCQCLFSAGHTSALPYGNGTLKGQECRHLVGQDLQTLTPPHCNRVFLWASRCTL